MPALLIVPASVLLLVILIVAARLPAFLSLLLAAFFAGAAGGLPLEQVPEVIREGLGATLGYIAVVVGLGALFAFFLEKSGAAQSLALSLIRLCGDRATPWALLITGMVIATPVFFDVAFILLVPLIYRLSQNSERSILYYAFPLLAGMAAAHSLIPPTPGPVAVAGLLGADLGWVILFGFAAALPAAVLSGIFFGCGVAARIRPGLEDYTLEDQELKQAPHGSRLGPVPALLLIALPMILILAGSISKLMLEEGSPIYSALLFLGHPFVALSLVVLVCFLTLRAHVAPDREHLQRLLIRALEPTASIVLLTGAGGALGRVLVEIGSGAQTAALVSDWELPVLLVGFLLAASVRISQGSATVAMVTAAGILAPILVNSDASEPGKAAAVVAIGCGATVVSHFNDSGFWLVSRYLGLSTRQALGTWTVMETLLGVSGFAALSLFFWLLF